MYKKRKKREQTNNRRDEGEKRKTNKNHHLLLLYTKKKQFVIIHTQIRGDIFTLKLFSFVIKSPHLFRMYRVVHCHYCYVLHSHLDYCLFDGHDHDHVIDVVRNLDDRAKYDAHHDVHWNVNVFDLKE